MRTPFAAVLIVVLGCSSRAPVAAPPAPAPGGTELDRLLHEAWREAGVTPAPPVDDAGFLRRVMLDLVGRIPTPEEVTAFAADPAPRAERRAALVDRLLASDEAAERWGRVTADQLLGPALGGAPARRRERIEGALAGWLADRFAARTSWDRIATELLAATGESEEAPQVWFVAANARGGAGVEAVAGAAARSFLGVQLQCAQCHDHPYDERYRQEDFWGFAAYFARTRARRTREGDGPPAFELFDVERGQARMQRPGSEERVVVAPRFLGRVLEHDRGERRRPVLARGVVGSDLFAKAAVNRAWAHLFGRGLVEPWDDLGGEHDPSHPALLVRLAKDFVAHGHDLAWLYRTIALSDAYARGSRGDGDPAAAIRVFARAAVRPLAAEPLVRSLVVATKIDDAMRGDEESIQRRLLRARLEYEYVSSDDEMTAESGFDGSVPQALLLLNGELLNRGVLAGNGTRIAEILDRHEDAAARIDACYLAAFARAPADDERARRLAWIERRGGGREAFEDLFFALLASSEFTTNH